MICRRTAQAIAQAHRQGNFEEVIRLAQARVDAESRDGFAWNSLGAAFGRMGRLEDALPALERAVELIPLDPAARSNLGGALLKLGRWQEAEERLRESVRIRPDQFLAWNNLGVLLRRKGDLAQAAQCLQVALRVRPDYHEAWNNLGLVRREGFQAEEAEACYRRALAIRPDFVEAHNNLGAALREQGRLDEAEGCCRAALEIRPELAEAHVDLALALLEQGHAREAEQSCRRALELRPDDVAIQSNLLFVLTCSSRGNESYRDQAVEFGRSAAALRTIRYADWSCSRPPERLRVGFVSGDLRSHAVGHFLEGILGHIDSGRLELLAYPSAPHADELTERIRPHFSRWSPIIGESDAQAAERIRADGVHVLVDLSGHTSHNRLPLFAYRPAPVQLAWLGYPASTGVPEIDYVLADLHSIPEGREGSFTEKVWRLPDTRLCFTAPAMEVPVGDPPARRAGRVTFSCFNGLNKVQDDVLDAWAAILHGVADSRLLLKARQFRSEAVRHDFLSRLVGRGVYGGRVELEGPSPRAEYLAAYNRTDLSLDPFPYTGGTTTAESLWMGVPVLTLAGESMVSRQGAMFLRNVGLEDFVTTTPEQYVRRAIEVAGDIDRLEHHRRTLRERALGSPIFNGARFARNFEDALWKIWESSGAAQSP